MSIKENKSIVRRYFEDAPYNPPACDEIFAKKIMWHALHHTSNPDFESSPQMEKDAYVRHKQVFGDWIEKIDIIIAEGDRVMVRWMGRGRQQGEYFGIPSTNREITLSGIYIFRIEDDRIAEVWNLWDRMGELQQLGVLSSMKEIIAEAREGGKHLKEFPNGIGQHVQVKGVDAHRGKITPQFPQRTPLLEAMVNG